MPACLPQSADLSSIDEYVAEAQRLDREAAALALNTPEARAEHERLSRASRDYYRFAANLFERADGIHMRDSESVYRYAEVLALKGDYDLAAAAYGEVSAREPGRIDALLGAAENYAKLSAQGAAGALPYAQRILDADAGVAEHSRADLARGTAYWKLGQFTLASEAFAAALARTPDMPAVLICSAADAFGRGDVAGAAGHLSSIQVAPPEMRESMNWWLREAFDLFLQNRVNFPDTAENHYAYSQLLIRVDLLVRADLVLARVVELDPDHYRGWNTIGSIALMSGDTERARAAYEASLAANPDQPATRTALERVTATEPQ